VPCHSIWHGHYFVNLFSSITCTEGTYNNEKVGKSTHCTLSKQLFLFRGQRWLLSWVNKILHWWVVHSSACPQMTWLALHHIEGTYLRHKHNERVICGEIMERKKENNQMEDFDCLQRKYDWNPDTLKSSKPKLFLIELNTVPPFNDLAVLNISYRQSRIIMHSISWMVIT
jgi:hypothetical protein